MRFSATANNRLSHGRSQLSFSLVLALLLISILFTVFIAQAQPIESPAPAPPNTYVVSNTNDSGEGSLRQGMDVIADGGTITFEPDLAGETITIVERLEVTKKMTIDAVDAPGLAISGGTKTQILYVEPAGELTLRNLTIRDGWDGGGGAGIENDGIVNIFNSTFTNNVADYGGAIENYGTMLIKNSTISGNEAEGVSKVNSGGGAINQYGAGHKLTIIFSTISNNTAPSVDGRGGIWVQDGTINISSSIVAGNVTNCAIDEGVALNVTSKNIDDDGSCKGFSDTDVADAKLGALAENGGPTSTNALLPGSPALDKITTCTDTAKDQRGIARPQGQACDAGAFEAEVTPPPPPPPPTGSQIFLPIIVAPPQILIAAGSNWKYLDNGADLGSTWRSASFDDSSWKSGKAQLGYGDGDETTVVGFGPDSTNKYITTYFRHSFNVPDPSAFGKLELQLLRDDGAVVYLNNREIKRSNMPGVVNYKTLAPSTIGGAGENTWHSFSIDAPMLVSGKNIIAVEIHQRSPGSSDISFDLMLTGNSQAASDSIRFAAIGDYGRADPDEARVAAMIDGWAPEFVITMGDNSYGNNDIDDNVGQFYADYIGDYSGKYGSGWPVNRFFPSIGNHDYTDGAGINAYLDYFTLPPGPTADERYYDFVRGPVHFFVIDSNPAGTGGAKGAAIGDGTKPDSVQGKWLKAKLAESNEPWKIVYFHHAPYSSSSHGDDSASQNLRWPFEVWGASAVIGGHDHTYERFQIGKIPYFVNGIGAAPGNRFCDEYNVVPQSKYCHDEVPGAMLIEAGQCAMTFNFYTHNNSLKDTYKIDRCG